MKVRKINVFSKKLGAVSSSSEIVEKVTESEIEVVRKFNRKFGQRGAALNRMVEMLNLGSASIEELLGRLLVTVGQYEEADVEARPAMILTWEEKGLAHQLKHNPGDRDGVFRFVIDGVGSDFSEPGFRYSNKNDNHDGLATPDRMVELLKGKPGRARVRPGAGKKETGYLVLVEQGVVNSATLAQLTGEPETTTSTEQGWPPRRPSAMGFKGPAASRPDNESSGS